jgi:hypothetical protein
MRVAESGSSRILIRDTACGSKHLFSGEFDDGLALVWSEAFPSKSCCVDLQMENHNNKDLVDAHTPATLPVQASLSKS